MDQQFLSLSGGSRFNLRQSGRVFLHWRSGFTFGSLGPFWLCWRPVMLIELLVWSDCQSTGLQLSELTSEVWGKSGDQISCALIVPVAWMVPSASSTTVVPCWAVTLFYFCLFVTVFGFVIKSQISPNFFEFGLLLEIYVRI